VVFQLLDPDGGGLGCGVEGRSLFTTPGYLRQTLSNATTPIVVPLSWGVKPDQMPQGEVFLELALHVEDAGSTAIIAPAVIDFDRQELGTSRSELSVVRNAGPTIVEIDSLWIGGSQRSEFGVRALGEPVNLPLPIALGRRDRAFSVELIPGHEHDLDPLWEAVPGFGSPHVRVRPTGHGGGQAHAYGATLDFRDGYALVTGSAPSPGVVAPAGTHLFAGRPVYPEQAVPFQLSPGQTFTVAVSAEPQGWGDRVAELHVEGYPIAYPNERFELVSVLLVEGAAAEARGYPDTFHFPTRGAYTLAALLENPGSLPLVRQTISIVGQHAQLFELESVHLTQDLDPGESESFAVRYDPAGTPIPAGLFYHEAQLEVATSLGTVTYELLGRDPLEVYPSSGLSFTGATRVLEVELHNSALHSIERRNLFTEGEDASLFFWADARPPVVLQPGQYESFEIEYTPRCLPQPTNPSNDRRADLLLVTDWGTARVALVGEYSSLDCD
jgi:hypothetical protein